MSYNAGKKARVKDLMTLAQRMKALTDELSERVSDLEEMASGIMTVTSASIANIDRGVV